jgi:putative endonuclease
VRTRARLADQRRTLGQRGEELAARYLTRHGMRVLQRNWRCRDGEIDILARQDRTLVVVEVKTRAGRRFGTPLEAVDETKRARLRALGYRWARDHGCSARIRVDVVGILVLPGNQWFLRHQRGVA